MPPNSLAVVCTARTAPVALSRAADVWSYSDIRSMKIMEASVKGQSFTRSNSLTPNGTPPKGQRDVGHGGVCSRPLEVRITARIEG